MNMLIVMELSQKEVSFSAPFELADSREAVALTVSGFLRNEPSATSRKEPCSDSA
jgi:hypothetical protein